VCERERERERERQRESIHTHTHTHTHKIGQVFAVLAKGEQGWMAFKLCYDVNDRKQQVLLTCCCAMYDMNDRKQQVLLTCC
jgi:hypothetical protein